MTRACCGMCANWSRFSSRLPMAGTCSLHGVRKQYHGEAPGCFASAPEWVPEQWGFASDERYAWRLMLDGATRGIVAPALGRYSAFLPSGDPRLLWREIAYQVSMITAARAVEEACRG